MYNDEMCLWVGCSLMGMFIAKEGKNFGLGKNKNFRVPWENIASVGSIPKKWSVYK